MAFARDVYTASAAQTDFTISFSYLDDAHIVVSQDGVTLTEVTDYTFPNATTVRLVVAATGGETIVLTRSSSQSTRLVDYTAGVLVESDLDTDSLQAFYMSQEAIDQVSQSLGKDTSELWDAESTRIINVATPSASTDAVTKAYADAISAAAGNVPTPGNPGEDNYLLSAGGGTWAWESPATIKSDLSLGALADLSTVDTAQIDDDAVTLAKMEHGTAGDVLYYGASGVPTRLAAGTTGQSLVMGASYPEWGGAGIPTGSVTSYLGTSAPTGWLLLNGDTLGSASSGATQASADNEDLFTLLWDNFADSEAAVSTGRGASAAADWSANKTIVIPDATGRTIFGKESSATRITSAETGVDGSVMGDSGGTEAHALSVAELAAHTHSYTAPTGNSSDVNSGQATGNASVSTGSAGSGSTHTNLPPALILSWIVKV